MYSVVMMLALGGSAEVQASCRGCSCSGYYGCSGYCSGCYGGRRARRCCGCCGGCYGRVVYSCGGCGGYMPPAKGEKLPPPKKSANDTNANLVVTLPADAKLTIDGQATKVSNSETRSFVTPPLEPGWDYHYQLRAEIVRDGQTRVLTQKVYVRAGQETRVSLMDFTNAAVAGNPSP